MRFALLLKRLIVLVLLLAAVLLLYAVARRHPEDLPWTPLDLAAPIGPFTGRKLTALSADPRQCRILLVRAGVADRRVAAVEGPAGCGYADGERVVAGGSRAIGYRPVEPVTRCAVAASLAVWEWNVVQPAAIARFGVPVTAIDHFGTYACRRIAGGGAHGWSEHATVNAIDVAGFRLADGRRVRVLGNWRGQDAQGRFLHDVRDGACRLFATVLSPDYNAAHRDHLHFDQAPRGTTGWRACR